MTTQRTGSALSRRTLLGAAAALAAWRTAGAQPSTGAQGYPKAPIRVVVPYPPGGPTDVVGRVVTTRLGEALGQPLVVDNKAGASGMVGAALVAKAPADGYTLLVNASIHVINPYVYASAPYDAFRDFEPVTQLVDVPLVLVVGSQLPVRNVQELIAWAKAHPGQVNFGSAGNASSQHLSGELFRLKTGAQMQHVPYKGSSPALTDLMGGQIQLMFDSMPSAMPFIASGRLRALAVTSASRSPSPARCAHHGRGRHAGLSHQHLVRTVGAEEHAPGRGAETVDRVPPRACRTPDRRAIPPPGRRARGLHARRVRALHPGRGPQVGRDREGVGGAGGLRRPPSGTSLDSAGCLPSQIRDKEVKVFIRHVNVVTRGDIRPPRIAACRSVSSLVAWV